MNSMIRSLVYVALILGSLTGSTFGAMLIYEPFYVDSVDGYTVGNIHGQNAGANAKTIGLTGNYAVAISGGAVTDPVANVVDTGLTFGALQTTGGAYAANPAVNFSRTPNVQLNLGADFTGTLYESYLINTGTLASGNGAAFTTFASASGATTNRRFRAAADGAATAGNTMIATRYNTNAFTNGDATLTANTVYMMLARFTNIGATLSTESPGVATAFALSVDQFNFLSAQPGGITDAVLDAATTGSANNQVSAKAVDSLATGTITLPQNYYLQLVLTNTASNTVIWDEVRYGTTWADVTPIPEPQSLLLIALGSILFAKLPRRLRTNSALSITQQKLVG